MKPTVLKFALPFGLLFAVAWAAGAWKTDPKQSTLSFIGTQAGAKFEGKFEQFAADIHFDPKNLSGGKFDVTIQTKSVNSKDKERDDILRGADLFAVDRWATARYVAEKFTAQGDKGDKFVAMGKLTLRDVTRDVPVQFTYQTDGNNAWLKGSTQLKRLDFGVGQGEWKDTQWVANDVSVQFTLRLQP
jgi:polyisoprenoid-binding protein YceI